MLCSLTLLVIVVLVIGLLLGANGFKKVIEHERNEISKCGGITLLMLAIYYETFYFKSYFYLIEELA